MIRMKTLAERIEHFRNSCLAFDIQPELLYKDDTVSLWSFECQTHSTRDLIMMIANTAGLRCWHITRNRFVMHKEEDRR